MSDQHQYLDITKVHEEPQYYAGRAFVAHLYVDSLKFSCVVIICTHNNEEGIEVVWLNAIGVYLRVSEHIYGYELILT